MKANELRIQNLLSVGNYDVKVVEIHHLGVQVWDLEETQDTWELFSDRIKPIPLTEEWLLKFGFEKGSDNWMVKNDMAIFLDKRFKTNLILRDSQENDWFSFNIKVLYIHQLQNLYFALMGEELTLKSE